MNEFQRGSPCFPTRQLAEMSLSFFLCFALARTYTRERDERSFQKRNFQQSCKFTLRFLAHHCRYSRNSEVAPLSSMLFLPSSASPDDRRHSSVRLFPKFSTDTRARPTLDGIRFGSGVWPDFLPETIGAGCFVSPPPPSSPERETFLAPYASECSVSRCRAESPPPK